jgi:eukaryotic-like serine/threonine-protein kinase
LPAVVVVATRTAKAGRSPVPAAAAPSTSNPAPDIRTTKPTPKSTPPRTSAPPAPGVPLEARGGVMRVRCDGDTAEVVGLTVASGYEIRDYDPGPASEIQVVLLSADNESEVKATCHNGTAVPRIKESPQ